MQYRVAGSTKQILNVRRWVVLTWCCKAVLILAPEPSATATAPAKALAKESEIETEAKSEAMEPGSATVTVPTVP